MRIAAVALAGAAFLGSSLIGCSNGAQENPGADPSTAVSGAPVAPAAAGIPGVVVGIPVAPEEVAKVVNPKTQPVYAGPTGTLRGVVHITGDPPPELKLKYPDSPCKAEAAAVHGKLFRVGQDGVLADALVAVTGYSAYVPAKAEAAKITIHNCTLSSRTLVAMFGQRIEVANLDRVDSYMPYLDGAATSAILVAIPHGDAVRLYPPQPGHYMIRDQLPNDHMTADVFVLAYGTTDVTGLDGKYEITGIPVGNVEVNAMLPATKKAAGQRIEIKPGDNTLDLTLTFDAAKDTPGAATAGSSPDAKDAKTATAKDAKDPKTTKPSGPKG
jgi:hypothetical protein